MVWYSHLFQKFPQFIVIHRVKVFGIVNKAEIDVFLELSCFRPTLPPEVLIPTPTASFGLSQGHSNLRCADDTTLMAESEEELKSLLMKVKEES